jgi:hypothetical protein
VDFLMPTGNFFKGEQNKIFASATIFKRDIEYHLFDHAVAGKQDLALLEKEWHFKSYGYFISKEHTFSHQLIPVCQIQHTFLQLIKDFLNEPRDFVCDHKKIENVCITPFHLNNRMFFAVHTLHYLRYVKIPSKEVFGPFDPLLQDTIEKQITWVVNKGYNWIYNNKAFSREFHGKTLVSAWKSLFLQDCGNCLDMAITMYQILMSYFRHNKQYTFALASVLVDNYLPHCICIVLPTKENKYGYPNIVDATRTIDVAFGYTDEFTRYNNKTYRYITGLYTQDNCYWIVDQQKNTNKIHLNVTIKQFLMNEYKTIDRYNVNKEYMALLKTAHLYEI